MQRPDGGVDLSGFPDHLVADAASGALLASAGTLRDDEATAKRVFHMLVDANGILSAGGLSEKDAFRSLTVSFASSQLVVTVSHDRIYCVRKAK